MTITRLIRSARATLAVPALIALAAAGCVEDATVEPVFTPANGGELFFRYVSMGNSITAGFQSGGINETLQRQAYPVVLAGKAGADFAIPAINDPGCPPPYAGPLTGQRISNTDCLARVVDAPKLVQNLAVPGARMADATDFTGPGLSFLTTLVTGGLSPADAMVATEPTLVSAWLGNNDALSAALVGDPALLTSQAEFQSDLDDLVAAIDGSTAQDAILIGVVDAATAAPALQPGAYYWLLQAAGPVVLGTDTIPLVVNATCDPATNPATAFNLVSLLVANDYLAGTTSTIQVSCADNAPYVLNATERATIAAAVADFNNAIEQAATDHGWIYLDPASILAPALANPDMIRKCQTLAAALGTGDPVQIGAAVQASCPGPTATNFFGSLISYDGVHPTGAAHQIIADSLAARLNDKHGLSLPTN